jgi:hypothetical protein
MPWDNIREPFGNGAIDAFLTAPVFSDRILSKSESATLPNRALFLVTGNNLRLLGDTCRHILPIRLDAEIEQPYAREFDFCPLATVLEARLSLVADALTLIRAWIAAGRCCGHAESLSWYDDQASRTTAFAKIRKSGVERRRAPQGARLAGSDRRV